MSFLAFDRELDNRKRGEILEMFKIQGFDTNPITIGIAVERAKNLVFSNKLQEIVKTFGKTKERFASQRLLAKVIKAYDYFKENQEILFDCLLPIKQSPFAVADVENIIERRFKTCDTFGKDAKVYFAEISEFTWASFKLVFETQDGLPKIEDLKEDLRSKDKILSMFLDNMLFLETEQCFLFNMYNKLRNNEYYKVDNYFKD